MFTKDVASVTGTSTINARAETVATAPIWREPFKKRRCLVPAGFFYEWKKLDAKTKQPFAFSVAGSSIFAFAGLWDAWKDGQGHWLQSFSIVTTSPNELLASVHTRMPVFCTTEIMIAGFPESLLNSLRSTLCVPSSRMNANDPCEPFGRKRSEQRPRDA